MRGLGLRWALGVAVSVLALPAAATAAGPLHFSAPRLIDTHTPSGSQHAIEAIDCPNGLLCVALDDAGNVLTASDPTAHDAWTLRRGVDISGTPQAVSCASEKLCVAVDSTGGVLSTASLGRTWKLVTGVDSHGDLTGVSCPTRRFCVAVDGHGNVLTSTNPTGSKRAWRARRVHGARQAFNDVACPSASVCVALDGGGLATTTNAGRTWHTSPYPRHLRAQQFDQVHISCPSTKLCVALISGDSNHLMTSANPGSGRSWRVRPTRLKGEISRVTGLACPSATLCVGGDEYGDVVAGPPGGDWRFTKVINHQDQLGTMVMTCFTTK